jgi:glycosyltransferase involved in cell wall biosynthesis
VPLLPVKAGRRVVTLHDVFHLANRHKLSFVQRMYAENVIRRAILLSDLTITVSEFSRSEIIKHTGLEKKIAVVHNGLDHGLFRPESPKEQMKSVDSFPYLLFVGNVKPHKNLKTALLAFQQIRDKYPELHFLIVGQKDNLITADHDVMNLARSDKRIHFKGIIEGEELADLYRRALLFVFPSVYESFGLPLIEAQACGCPVLMSDTASPPEVCADSVLYCAPFNVLEMAQKIVEIMESQQLRQDLIDRGYRNAARFSWEKAAEQTSRELQQLF